MNGVYESALMTASYVNALFNYLKALGVDPQQLYTNSKITQPTFFDPTEQIYLADAVYLFQQAIDLLDDPELPIKVGNTIRVKDLGAIAQVLISCETVREAIHQLTEYKMLLDKLGAPGIVIDNDYIHVTVEWRLTGEAPLVLVQFFQSLHMTIFKWFTGIDENLCHTHFCFSQPSDIACYERVFGKNLHFNQSSNKLMIPASYIDMPFVIPTYSPQLKDALLADAVAKFHQTNQIVDIHSQIQNIIIDHIHNGFLSLEEVAKHLSVSPRTLQRKLTTNGSSYKQVISDIKQSIALEYINNPEISLLELSQMLGYSEQSSFQVAFKQWTGTTPFKYRLQGVKQKVQARAVPIKRTL